jgi:hypothetical protein
LKLQKKFRGPHVVVALVPPVNLRTRPVASGAAATVIHVDNVKRFLIDRRTGVVLDPVWRQEEEVIPGPVEVLGDEEEALSGEEPEKEIGGLEDDDLRTGTQMEEEKGEEEEAAAWGYL